ncbi:MAG: DUF262 domain-containing protein [Mariniphaga sp.]
MKIQEFINHRNKYKVDYTYQRPSNAWSMEDKQCLIDTILKEEPLPTFFLNHKTDENIYYIVDGQQRLNCIEQFYENKFKLNEKFSGKNLAGKTFSKEKPLEDDDQSVFLNYNLNFHIMTDYDDDKVRIIFSRLQRGKPLSLGERLNAKPGSIVGLMRDLAKHNFIEKSTGVAKNRYGVFPDVARILFYEKYRAKQCGSKELYSFFDDFKDLDRKSEEYKDAINTLNFLEKCFSPTAGHHAHLEKHAWVLAVYTMVRDLKKSYSLTGKEKVVEKFIIDFHGKVYSEDFRKSKSIYQKFYDNVRGGWSEKIIEIRRNILINEFKSKYTLSELDDKRQISDEEKISIFALKKNCELCNISFKDYRAAEYHHIERYTDGGKTKSENIMILCGNCHVVVHRKSEIAE